jgi:hypothetical protein
MVTGKTVGGTQITSHDSRLSREEARQDVKKYPARRSAGSVTPITVASRAQNHPAMARAQAPKGN